MHVIKLPKNSSAGRKLNSTGQIFFLQILWKTGFQRICWKWSKLNSSEIAEK